MVRDRLPLEDPGVPMVSLPVTPSVPVTAVLPFRETLPVPVENVVVPVWEILPEVDRPPEPDSRVPAIPVPEILKFPVWAVPGVVDWRLTNPLLEARAKPQAVEFSRQIVPLALGRVMVWLLVRVVVLRVEV